MTAQVELCIQCAWREDCKKKYLVSGDPLAKCAEFSRDMRIKKDKPEKSEEPNREKKKK